MFEVAETRDEDLSVIDGAETITRKVSDYCSDLTYCIRQGGAISSEDSLDALMYSIGKNAPPEEDRLPVRSAMSK